MSNQHNYRIDDIVWAKVTGYDWWPAKIAEKRSTDKQGEELRVEYFGHKSHSLLLPSKIRPYNQRPVDKPLGRMSKTLQRAIDLANRQFNQEEDQDSESEESIVRPPQVVRQDDIPYNLNHLAFLQQRAVLVRNLLIIPPQQNQQPRQPLIGFRPVQPPQPILALPAPAQQPDPPIIPPIAPNPTNPQIPQNAPKFKPQQLRSLTINQGNITDLLNEGVQHECEKVLNNEVEVRRLRLKMKQTLLRKYGFAKPHKRSVEKAARQRILKGKDRSRKGRRPSDRSRSETPENIPEVQVKQEPKEGKQDQKELKYQQKERNTTTAKKTKKKEPSKKNKEEISDEAKRLELLRRSYIRNTTTIMKVAGVQPKIARLNSTSLINNLLGNNKDFHHLPNKLVKALALFQFNFEDFKKQYRFPDLQRIHPQTQSDSSQQNTSSQSQEVKQQAPSN